MVGITRIGLCWGTVRDMPVVELIEIAARHGYGSVMPIPLQLVGDGVPPARALRRRLDDAGVGIVTLDGVLSMLPRMPQWVLDLGLPEDEYFRLADELGITCFNVPHYRGDPATPLAELVDAVGPIVLRARRHGIQVALEFLPGTGIPDLATALRIADAVGTANVGVMIDSWHLARGRNTPADVRALAPGFIKGYQISDRAADADRMPDDEMYERLVPGEGVLPLAEITRAVLANAPGLVIDAEVFAREVREGCDAAASDGFAGRVAAGIRTVLDRL